MEASKIARTMSIRLLAAVLFLVAGCAVIKEPREEDFLRVLLGMSQEEVRRAIGEPTYVEAFARQRQLAWDYPFTDSWGYVTTMSVIFDEGGRVVAKIPVRRDREDN
jgi:outer membrane protein assembly factor BamE (lipoprotein component of BamABCDE complex)